MKDEIVTINKNGQNIQCETLFTFDSDDTGKHYIAYTDRSVNDKGEENIFISSFDPNLGTKELKDLDDLEMEMALDVIKRLKSHI